MLASNLLNAVFAVFLGGWTLADLRPGVPGGRPEIESRPEIEMVLPPWARSLMLLGPIRPGSVERPWSHPARAKADFCA